MSTQDELFHEDWRDALVHLVKALGGYDAAGAELWPAKTRKAAGSWLYDCLHVDRPAKLDLEDLEALLRMGRDKGCHVAVHMLADSAGYERPQPAAPKSQRTVLLEQQAAHAEQIARLQREIDRLDNGTALRAVRKGDETN